MRSSGRSNNNLSFKVVTSLATFWSLYSNDCHVTCQYLWQLQVLWICCLHSYLREMLDFNCRFMKIEVVIFPIQFRGPLNSIHRDLQGPKVKNPWILVQLGDLGFMAENWLDGQEGWWQSWGQEEWEPCLEQPPAHLISRPSGVDHSKKERSVWAVRQR